MKCISQINSYKLQYNGLVAKACNVLKIISLVPSEWEVLVSLFTNKTVKMLSHIDNITVYSVSSLWRKLWLRFWWQLLKMPKAAVFLYGTYQFKHKVSHYLPYVGLIAIDRIHIYTFTFCTVTCWQTMSLRYKRLLYSIA